MSEKKAQEFIKYRVDLSLVRKGTVAHLTSKRNGGLWGSKDARVNLFVTLPPHLNLKVEDGSGSTEVRRMDGDRINIAARLEAIADPGGICISRTVYDHIEDKLPLEYEYLGKKKVKNIPKVVQAYRIMMEQGDIHDIQPSTSALK